MQAQILEVNRRLANLLSSSRLYRDHLLHAASELCGRDEAKNLLEHHCQVQYDTRRGFRVLEGMRNVVQHTNLCVHELSYPHDRQGAELRIRVIPYVHVTKLRDTPMKPAIVQELAARREKHALTPLVREYLEGLGSIQNKARELSDERTSAARATLTEAIDRTRRA